MTFPRERELHRKVNLSSDGLTLDFPSIIVRNVLGLQRSTSQNFPKRLYHRFVDFLLKPVLGVVLSAMDKLSRRRHKVQGQEGASTGEREQVADIT